MFTAVGMTCGIGSMVLGARGAGAKILGNVEWRDYYHHRDPQGRNTFTENFPGAFFVKSLKTMPEIGSPDIVMGHPECGKYSVMAFATTRKYEDVVKHQASQSDIPLFVEGIQTMRPKYFAMDDMPLSLIPCPITWYANLLPDYELWPEWVDNAGYGNSQIFRKRMFIIGAKRGLKYTFVPHESRENYLTTRSVIGHLPEPGTDPDHMAIDWSWTPGCTTGLVIPGRKESWRTLQTWYKDWPRTHMMYFEKNGTWRRRPMICRTYWDRHCHVVTGNYAVLHPHRVTPLTPRERGLIQGFPESFKFYGSVSTTPDGLWKGDGGYLHKQTGKAMPIKTNLYFAKTFIRHAEGSPIQPEHATRAIEPHALISKAKTEWCQLIGYEDQQSACRACWLQPTCTLPRRKT